MNVRTLLLWGIIAILLLQPACQNPTGPEQQVTSVPTSVRGIVMRNDNLTPIANAIVYDIAGLARDTSKSDGSFRLVYQLLSQTKTTIIGSRSGFGNDTARVTLNPGVDTTIVLRLRADSTSPSGPISSGKAANIVLVSSSSENISIRGTGSNETANLVFEVRDSLGLPIAGVNKLTVNFNLTVGPGGGEYVFPASEQTDPLTGRVITKVSSGSKAGVVQIVATATVPVTPAIVIKSSPVKITISGGLPDSSHFSVSGTPTNIAGGKFDNLRAQIIVIVGDREGNPVQEGTAISFTTTGGIIQPNAVTNKDGIAQVALISGNPRPPNSVAIVTATTINDSGKAIHKSIPVLFSGATTILPPSSVTVPDSGSASFQFRVQDPNGFPLVGGTNITVTVDGPGSGQLELSGDASKILEDSSDPNTTLFKATVRDKVLHGPAGQVTFKITVTSQNGNSSVTFSGVVLSDTNVVPVPSKSGYISSLTLEGIDNSQISVRGTGANENAKLTFLAKDSVGNPVELRKRAYVTFSISPTGGIGGGEFLFPAADSTDAYGQVGTTFNAGTHSGVVQVIARATAFGRTVTSSPIRITIAGGLPDSSHFTATLTSVNMPGLVKTGTLGTVNVQVGDKFGNAVQPGTALYFSTSGGLIQATAVTDNGGQAGATIQGGNPIPNEPSIGGPGHGFITVQTVGDAGASVLKKIPFLFSGATRIVTPTTLVVVPDSGTATFQYRIQDLNNNPLVAGSTVSLTVDGPGSGGLELSGDVSKTLLDSDDPNTTVFTATVRDKVLRGPAGDITFHLNVVSQNGNATASFAGVVLKDTSSTPPVVTPPTTGYTSNLTLFSITSPSVSVRGTGANEAARLTFVAKDSLGNPVEIRRHTYVTFSISPVGGVGGGEFLFPVGDTTDASGKVSTTFNAGTRAGVVQVIAQTIVGGQTITSSPIKITISGGLPNDAHFSISRLPLNIAGGVFDNLRSQIMVVVGDREGNPVQPGTAVSFTTTGGIVQPNATTDANGIAQVDLISGNPRPPNSIAIVTAKTIGDSGKFIQRSTTVLFSGPTTIVTPSSPVVIPDSGVATFQYRVQDPNGSPLVAGTTVALSVDGPGSGQLELSGDVSKTLEDTNDPSSTLFTVTVRDKVLKGPAGAITFHINVVSKNNNASANFPGLVLQDTSATPPVVTPSKSGYASSLELLAPQSASVSVRGTGASETVRITLVAKDSVGNAVEIRRRAYVTFAITPTPIGGQDTIPFLYPTADSTDAFGQVGTTFNAGIRAGVVQVTAQTVVNGRTIKSAPIKITISSGLPDFAHFTATMTPQDIGIWPSAANVPVAQVTVQVGDRYGNPVQAGTALYFSTTAGIIQPRASTDANGGIGSGVTLFGGNPLPVGDSAQVTVQTVGEGGVSIARVFTFHITSTFRSGVAASLTIGSVTATQLSVRGTGATESSTLTFVAKDSSGNLLDVKRRIFVNFSISPTGGIGGGEYLSPAGAYTDTSGQVSTTFNAGIRAGVVQIVATANVAGQTISAASGRITISGGFPDSTKLTATLSRLNMPGLAKSGALGTLSVQLGDRFGNPVQPGTPVSFSTTGGLIQPSALTDNSGQAIVTLQGGNPAPNDAAFGGPGYGHITLQTIGENGLAIRKDIPFLFSGSPQVTLLNVPNDTVKVFDGASVDIDYTVTDINGNPVSGGHRIAVSVSGQGAAGVALSGDVGVNTPDTQDKVNFTHYRFRISDAVTNGGPSGELVFTITVSGESGTFIRKFYGFLYSPQVATTVPPSAHHAAQIAFLGITTSDLYVAGVGNTENAVITYEVRDSLGVPIDKTERVLATFGITFYPNSSVGGGTPPTVIPGADSTDNTGKLRAAIVSGTQAGVIQIVARIQLPGGRVIVSEPDKITVHAGFADQAHFTFVPSRFVFPNFDAINQVSFTTVVGDTFSNPVQSGTAIYFHSQAGVMQTGTNTGLSSYTNATGIAGATLFTANPLPSTPPYEYVPGPADPFFNKMGAGSPGGQRVGYHWVWAQTTGKGGKTITDSILVAWNRAPIVVTGIPAATVNIASGGTSAPISITVKDVNGNPLCDGTTITTSISYTTLLQGISFGVDGDLSSAQAFVMPVAGYCRFPGPGVTDFTFNVSDLSLGGQAAGMTILVQITIDSPGLARSVVSFHCHII